MEIPSIGFVLDQSGGGAATADTDQAEQSAAKQPDSSGQRNRRGRRAGGDRQRAVCTQRQVRAENVGLDLAGATVVGDAVEGGGCSERNAGLVGSLAIEVGATTRIAGGGAPDVDGAAAQFLFVDRATRGVAGGLEVADVAAEAARDGLQVAKRQTADLAVNGRCFDEVAQIYDAAGGGCRLALLGNRRILRSVDSPLEVVAARAREEGRESSRRADREVSADLGAQLGNGAAGGE